MMIQSTRNAQLENNLTIGTRPKIAATKCGMVYGGYPEYYMSKFGII